MFHVQKIQLQSVHLSWTFEMSVTAQFYFCRRNYKCSYKDIMGPESLQYSTDAIKI